MNLHTRLEELFRNTLNDDSIRLTDETTSADLPGWDSLAHINLMFAIEQQFSVQFHGNELGEFRNIGELKQYLSRHGAAACA